MAHFLVKFPIFRYHGNRGRLSKFWLTIKLADPENPLVGASIWVVSHAQAELYPILCWKSQIFVEIANFRCHGNQGMSEQNVTGIVELADPENHVM